MARAPKKNLVYTIAFDPPQSEGYRFLGKMLSSSLLKTFFTGDIVVFRNSPAPLFLVERKGLEEVYIETPAMHGQEGAEEAWCWKYRVAELIENPEQYDKILFLDCDSLALRNIDHLLEGDWDIACQPERGKPVTGRSFNAFLTEEEMSALEARSERNGEAVVSPLQPEAGTLEGANSGTLAVRGAIFHEVMEAWRDLDESEPVRGTGFRDQASWNALLVRRTDRVARGHGLGETGTRTAGPEMDRQLETAATGGSADPGSADAAEVSFGAGKPMAGSAALGSTAATGKWRTVHFPAGEVQFPGYLDPHYASYSKAALTHNIMADTLEKIQFTFGLYMRTFYCDPTGLFFSML